MTDINIAVIADIYRINMICIKKKNMKSVFITKISGKATRTTAAIRK